MDKVLLNQAIKCLNIQDVHLRFSQMSLNDDFDPKLSSETSAVVQFRNGCTKSEIIDVEVEGGENIRILNALYECAYRIVPGEISEDIRNKPEEMDKITLAEVRAYFVAEYLLSCPDISDEALDAFCKINVGYHVWPFWREFAQSAADRLRLPKITIPLYKIPDN